MSNEFEVHNFYNHTIEQLEELKSECAYLCDSAIAFKNGMGDLNGSLTKSEWYAKHDNGACDDDMLFEEAESFFTEEIGAQTDREVQTEHWNSERLSE